MCGLFGVVGRPDTLARVREDAVFRALRRRGPDDAGRFVSSAPRAGDAAACLLLHTRLAVLDVSTRGRQPMTTADGRWTVAYNGEIYNFASLRRELEADGAAFRSSGDTEVLLAGFARHGDAFVSRLRGMFAFAMWDDVERRLFLVRDHLGVKPLYYAVCGPAIVFGSELRAVLASGLIERTLSDAGIGDYLSTGSVSDPNTMIQQVRSLLPGTILEHRSGSARLHRYWALRPDVDAALTFHEAAEALRPVLREAVRSQLVSDVPLGVFLSGGVDSCTVVAQAAAVAARVHAVSLSFDEGAYDEAPLARSVAAHYGCAHTIVRTTAQDALAALPMVLSSLDQPSVDGANTFLVSQAARRAGLTVALSGIGGDEVFAGYAHARHFGRYLAAGRLTRPVAALAGTVLAAASRRGVGGAATAAGGALVRAGGDPAQTYRVLRRMFSPDEQATVLHQARRAPVAGAGAGSALLADAAADGVDPVNDYCRLELSGYLRNTLLRDTDVMSMAWSLEVRVPLLDIALVEQAGRIPGLLKVSRTINKPLLRALTPTLLTAPAGRPKRGFTLPFDPWLRGPLRHWVEERLFDPSVDRLQLFDRASVRSLWEAFLQSRATWSRVWCIAALNAWSSEHLST